MTTKQKKIKLVPPYLVYKPKVYLSNPSGGGPFPEVSASDRFSPAKRPIGVCVSGGGIRSFTAAIGQLRALENVPGNFMDLVGAVSTVSGGSWFNSIYHFAPSCIDDRTLLGPMIAPEKLTASDINNLDSGFIGSWMPKSSNTVLRHVLDTLLLETATGIIPRDRFWSRGLNRLLLKHFQLDDITRQFAQTAGAVNNPYLPRANRPYFIVNATQVYPTGDVFQTEKLRHFEFTSMYSGTSQLFRNMGKKGRDFGGGYVDSYAFDSKTPLSIYPPVTVKVPDPVLLLSDVMGASSAAPEAILDSYGFTSVGFPKFNYWSPIHPGMQKSAKYPFADGGSLEDTGIVPLLRRQYPFIVAFVNAELPIGSTSHESVDGVSGQIARLFGSIPRSNSGNKENTQVFGADAAAGKALFSKLVAGLKANANTGAFFTDSYDITQPNTFDIPAYTTGKVQVLWFHLNKNTDWETLLESNSDSSIAANLADRSRSNNFANFPNYDTFGQNWDLDILGEKLREPFYLTPQQVSLMANMSAYSVGCGHGLNAVQAIQQQAISLLV